MVKKKFKIDGMHCSSCAILIDGDLEDLNGVKSASTNYAKSETEIEYDQDKISPEKLVEMINKTGYFATLIETSDFERF